MANKRSYGDLAKAEAASRGRKADVADHMKRLQGSSRDDLTGDRVRGASSPLGHGKRVEKVRGK